MSPVPWQQLASAKRQALLAKIPIEWRLSSAPCVDDHPNVLDWARKHLSADEVLITETPPLSILANIHASLWSSENVVSAFCHRAALAHQLVNCLTEFLYNEAILAAKKLDDRLRETGVLAGPLHGLPVSFMDRFRVAGAETSAGFVSWLGPQESLESESSIVEDMRRLGAIPICKTNLPQSMMLSTTTNNIFGRTANPYNRQLSSGGAAGGEGALLAMRGSPLGWATEMAGSARIPACFNNLFALKSCAGRLGVQGIASSSPDLPVCNFTVAIMSWDLGIIQHVSRLCLGSRSYRGDPEWLDIPWRETRFQTFRTRRPTFAMMSLDGYVRPQPPVLRALSNTRLALESQGYQVISWNPPAHNLAVEDLFRIIGADGAINTYTNLINSAEPPVPQLKDWYQSFKHIPALPTREFWTLCKKRREYMHAYHTYWRSSGTLTEDHCEVDGIVMPVVAEAVCNESELTYFGYSAVVNYLDYTATAFPVLMADGRRDVKSTCSIAMNAEDAKVHTSYDPYRAHGMPVGLQIVCRRTEEETCLSLAEIIVNALSNTPLLDLADNY